MIGFIDKYVPQLIIQPFLCVLLSLNHKFSFRFYITAFHVTTVKHPILVMINIENLLIVWIEKQIFTKVISHNLH